MVAEPAPVAPTAPLPVVTPFVSAPPSRPSALSVAEVLGLAWACGLLALVSLAGWRYAQWCRLIRQGRRLSDPRLLALLDGARQAMGVRRPVTLVAMARLGSPAVFGFRRVRLLLPETALDQLTDQDLRLLFLHEMAHVRRHDMLLNVLLMAVQFVHWFNPLLWLGLHRLRADRELVCDAMVLQRTRPEERLSYGSLLLKLLTDFPADQAMIPTAVPVVSSQRELKRRIILIKHQRSASRGVYVATVMAAVALACLTFTGSSQQSPAAPESATRSAITNSSASNGPSTPGLPAEQQPLETRFFRVSTNQLIQGLHLNLAPMGTNDSASTARPLLDYFKQAGVDLDRAPSPGKSGLFYDDRRGILIVRATPLDLDIVEHQLFATLGIAAASGAPTNNPIIRSLYHDYSRNSIWHDRNSRTLDKETTIHLDNVPLEALLATLSTNAGVYIVPDKSLSVLTNRLSVNLDRVKFRDLLVYLGRNYALQFEVGDEFIWALDGRPGNRAPEETKIWILPKEALAVGKDAGSSTPLLSERAIKDQFKGIYMIDPKNLMLAARGTPEQLGRLDTVINEVWAKLPKRVSPWVERWKADQRVQVGTPEFRALIRAALATQSAELTNEQRADLERLLDLWGRAYNTESFERFMEFRAPSRIEVLGSSLERMTNWMATYKGESVNGLTPRELLQKSYKYEDTFALTDLAQGSLQVIVRRVGDLEDVKDDFLGICFDFRRDDTYSSPSDKSPCKYDLDPQAVLAANKSLLCVGVAGAYFTSVGKDHPIPVLTFFYWVPSQSVWRPMRLFYGNDPLGDQRNKGWGLYF